MAGEVRFGCLLGRMRGGEGKREEERLGRIVTLDQLRLLRRAGLDRAAPAAAGDPPRARPAYRARLPVDPEFLLWGLRFLGHALPARFAANTGHLLALAAATRRLMARLAEIDTGRRRLTWLPLVSAAPSRLDGVAPSGVVARELDLSDTTGTHHLPLYVVRPRGIRDDTRDRA